MLEITFHVSLLPQFLDWKLQNKNVTSTKVNDLFLRKGTPTKKVGYKFRKVWYFKVNQWDYQSDKNTSQFFPPTRVNTFVPSVAF